MINNIIYIELLIDNEQTTFYWTEYWSNEFFYRTNNLLINNEITNWDNYFLNENYYNNNNLNELVLNILNNYINNDINNDINPINIELYTKHIINIKEILESCPICFIQFDNYDKITLCGHKFCKKCLEEWLLQHNSTCPICRIELNK